MRLFTSMPYCRMSLVCCHPGTGTTSITFSIGNGREPILSKLTTHAGDAVFHSLASPSGRCYYLIHVRICVSSGAVTCTRHERERFALAVGQVREVRGLDAGVGQCASASAIQSRC